MNVAAHYLGTLAVAGLLAGALFVATPASGQTAPTAEQGARYEGLHAAAYHGHVADLGKLLAEGAKPDVRDAHGRTPLHVATFRWHPDVIRSLARAGADLGALENDRYDAVTIAAVADDEQTLDLLLSLGASAGLVTSRYDGTALIAAAHLGHAGVVRRLIDAGAPLDHVNNLHWTAVIESIVLGDGGTRHRETLAALVGAGADLGITDRAGKTPLALAKSRGYEEMTRMLEAAGSLRPSSRPSR